MFVETYRAWLSLIVTGPLKTIRLVSLVVLPLLVGRRKATARLSPSLTSTRQNRPNDYYYHQYYHRRQCTTATTTEATTLLCIATTVPVLFVIVLLLLATTTQSQFGWTYKERSIFV
uniref:Uncharacterized protein n=1 Tax=Octopus bimaculoides TaxID=37653 RepID=A0A0L8GIX7_OCTBM